MSIDKNIPSTAAAKCLIIVHSYHHHNTAKIAEAMAQVLAAEVKSPQEADPTRLGGYDLIGLGAGIDSGQHYQPLLDFADQLPAVNNQAVFIFSTSAMQGKDKVDKDHAALREKLVDKHYLVLDEFSCKGLDTNSFLRYLGGLNKGHPDDKELQQAREFAAKLLNMVN